MQANGAEMLRLACSLATERGIAVAAPVHDALLIEAPVAALDEAVAATQAAMEEASAVVLDGFRLRSDAKLVRHPDRYEDERGREMWKAVWDCIDELGATAERASERGVRYRPSTAAAQFRVAQHGYVPRTAPSAGRVIYQGTDLVEMVVSRRAAAW